MIENECSNDKLLDSSYRGVIASENIQISLREGAHNLSDGRLQCGNCRPLAKLPYPKASGYGIFFVIFRGISMVKIKIVHVFDEDMAIREMLWNVFKPLGYLIHCHPNPGSCPGTFYAKLDCKSGRACGEFILASVDDPGISRFEIIKNQIIKKKCKVRNIGLMSITWSNTDLEVAQDLGCEPFLKPFTAEAINSWIESCKKKPFQFATDEMSECAVLQL
ncbi:MAG: hypothetical protein ACE5FY_08045 [Nitrospiria bacterium]